MALQNGVFDDSQIPKKELTPEPPKTSPNKTAYSRLIKTPSKISTSS